MPEEHRIENGCLPVRVGNIYGKESVYVVNVSKLVSEINELTRKLERQERKIKELTGIIGDI